MDWSACTVTMPGLLVVALQFAHWGSALAPPSAPQIACTVCSYCAAERRSGRAGWSAHCCTTDWGAHSRRYLRGGGGMGGEGGAV